MYKADVSFVFQKKTIQGEMQIYAKDSSDAMKKFMDYLNSKYPKFTNLKISVEQAFIVNYAKLRIAEFYKREMTAWQKHQSYLQTLLNKNENEPNL